MSRAPKWKRFIGWARPSNGKLFHFWTNGRIRCGTGILTIADGYHPATSEDMLSVRPCGSCLKLTQQDTEKDIKRGYDKLVEAVEANFAAPKENSNAE